MAKTKRALVLGGGGVAGIGWETGILFGLAEHGVDVLDADLVIGTSAGAAVAAQVTSGVKLAELYDKHAFPEGPSTELEVEFDVDKMVSDWAALLNGAVPGPELRAAIGRYALTAPTVPERRRREVIEARLPSHQWPDRPLQIVTVDAATGEERIFTADDGAELVDVVAASCAVPGVWPPVTIAGRRYVDGGIRTAANVDLAAGHKRILVLAPVPDMGPTDPALAKALAKVEKAAKILTIRPDDATVAVMGSNPLDPATAKPAAQAGRAQAEALVDNVRAIWED